MDINNVGNCQQYIHWKKKLAGKARGELNKNCIFNTSDDHCITMQLSHAIYGSLILENLNSKSLKVTPSKNIPEAHWIECLSLFSISVYREEP